MSPAEAAAIIVRLDMLREDVGEVKELAQRTNGRVTALELWRARVDGAIATASAARPWLLVVATGVVSFVVGRLT